MISPHNNSQIQCEICEIINGKYSHVKNLLFFARFIDSKLNFKKIIDDHWFTCQNKNYLLNYLRVDSQYILDLILHFVEFNSKFQRFLVVKSIICNSNNNNLAEVDTLNNNMSDIRSNTGNGNKSKPNCEDKKVILNLAEEKASVLNQMKIKEEKRKYLRALDEENRKKQETTRLQEKRRMTEVDEKDNEQQIRKLNNLIRCDEYVNFEKEVDNKDQTKAPKTYLKRMPAKPIQKDKKQSEMTSVESKISKKPSKELKTQKEPKDVETDHGINSEIQSSQLLKEDNMDENTKKVSSLNQTENEENIRLSKEEARKQDDLSKELSEKSAKEEPKKEIAKGTEEQPPKTLKPPLKHPTPVRKPPQKSTPVVRTTRPTQPSKPVKSRRPVVPMDGRKPKKFNNTKTPNNKKETPNVESNPKEQEINVIEPIEEDNVKPSSYVEQETLVKKNNAGCCQTGTKKNKPSIETSKDKPSSNNIKNDSHELKEIEENNVLNNSKTGDTNNQSNII